VKQSVRGGRSQKRVPYHIGTQYEVICSLGVEFICKIDMVGLSAIQDQGSRNLPTVQPPIPRRVRKVVGRLVHKIVSLIEAGACPFLLWRSRIVGQRHV